MAQSLTYELKLFFASEHLDTWSAVKPRLMTWLMSEGVESFVEGVVDDLYVDHRYDQSEEDFYDELGGNNSPLIIYDYNLEFLEELKAKAVHAFEHLTAEISSFDTQVWKEGWKESFKPIYTHKFSVFPPWERVEEDPQKFQIIIDPGMAFGTGQHATTQLCLKMLESFEHMLSVAGSPFLWKGKSVLDVGTGTGVLSLAASKLGASRIVATDIDHNAVEACKENAGVNEVDLYCEQSSVPQSFLEESGEKADVVIANILFVVLEKIIPQLAQACANGGAVLLSGVLVEQTAEMIRLAEGEGLKLLSHQKDRGWSGLLFGKPPTSNG